jgi:uncharacterized protein YacL (UPF0231 family)
MDYEFSRDLVKGGYHVKFSMEHEVFSPWLIDEVGNDSQQLKTLFQSIALIRACKAQELMVEGREYRLTLNLMDVIIELNASCEGVGSANANNADPVGDGETVVNNDNFVAACGLDDFDRMLISWQNFLSENR